MAKLIVQVIDAKEKGSYKLYRTVIRLGREIKEGNLASQEELAELVERRARTDDGSPLQSLLDELSLDDYLELARGLVNNIGETIPNASTPSSNAG